MRGGRDRCPPGTAIAGLPPAPQPTHLGRIGGDAFPLAHGLAVCPMSIGMFGARRSRSVRVDGWVTPGHDRMFPSVRQPGEGKRHRDCDCHDDDSNAEWLQGSPGGRTLRRDYGVPDRECQSIALMPSRSGLPLMPARRARARSTLRGPLVRCLHLGPGIAQSDRTIEHQPARCAVWIGTEITRPLELHRLGNRRRRQHRFNQATAQHFQRLPD